MTLTLATATLAAPQATVPAPQIPSSVTPGQPVTGTAVIRGRVTSLDTGKPLRRAQIRLTSDGYEAPRTASTANDGRYELRGIPPGRYTLRVQRSGYLALHYGQRRPGEQPRPVDIADKDVLEKVDFALPRMGIISGRVLDELGEPIAGVTVWALQPRYFDGRRTLVPAGESARTDVTGQYRLLSLPPGDFAVMGTTRESWPLDTDPTQIFAFAPTYFPGTPSASAARRVKLGAGEEASGIDFSLVPGKTARVSGIATSVSGAPLAGETVTMLYEMAGPGISMGASIGSATVAGDGIWTFTNVAPGEYRLSIRTAGRDGQPGHEGHLTIGVTGAALEGLRLVASAGGTVRGEVVTDDGSALPPGFDRLQVRPPLNPGSRTITSLPAPDNGRVRGDGTFEVHGVRSGTVLSIGPLPDDWALKAIEVEGRDLADTALPVEPGGTLTGVRVVLTNRPTTLRGVLRDEKRNPADGTVVVFAEDSAKWQDGSRAVRATRPDQRGLFTFKGLPAGDYLLIALEYVADGQWHDPEFLEGLKARAARVSIGDAEAKQMDLVVRK